MPWNKPRAVSLRLPQRQALVFTQLCSWPPRTAPSEALAEGELGVFCFLRCELLPQLHLLKHTVPAGSGATHLSCRGCRTETRCEVSLLKVSPSLRLMLNTDTHLLSSPAGLTCIVPSLFDNDQGLLGCQKDHKTSLDPTISVVCMKLFIG